MTWELAAQAAKIRAEDEEALRHGMVSLSGWPDLNQVPHAVQPMVARVCALLGHRPSAGILIPTLLALPRQDVFRVLVVLSRMGHVKVTAASSGESRSTPVAEAQRDRSLDVAMTAEQSVVTRLWGKFLSWR